MSPHHAVAHDGGAAGLVGSSIKILTQELGWATPAEILDEIRRGAVVHAKHELVVGRWRVRWDRRAPARAGLVLDEALVLEIVRAVQTLID